ncbi:MAG: DNA polymerase III subunit gamma/tau [Candidatus Paceibacterota bacterium]|jgi:DNA polymerase-3 subunit gamma/tau
MTVLYRTYRPAKWSEVVGQEHIVDPLKDSIANKRIAHAYLFSGGRGIGKTTLARIFAKSVGAKDEDIYEIDAASNRGIDDIRSLREHVSVLPFSSPYKVYIIDEVHMLSKDAWNALLKTLEEPPQHVIFILATTELDKVPDTIISRCQTFSFRKPSRDIVRKQVESIAKSEKYELDPGAADLIALLGDGSFRDALGMLEKVIGSSNKKKINREDVEAITGSPKASLVNDFVSALLGKDVDGALYSIGQGTKSGVSMSTFVTLVLEKVRFILLLQHSPQSKRAVGERLSPDDMDFVAKEGEMKRVTPAMLVVLLEAADATGRAKIESLPLEIAVVRICES